MRLRVIVVLLVLGVLALGYVAWQRNAAPVPQESAGGPVDASPPQAVLRVPEDPGIDWDAPEAWSATPGSGMRLATYTISGPQGSAECAVFYFGVGQGGPVDLNIERWIGEFEHPTHPERTTRRLGDFTVTRVRVTGEWVPHSMTGGGPAAPRAEHALLGAIVETPVGPVFFKLTGPRATVDRAAADFDRMLGSVRRRS